MTKNAQPNWDDVRFVVAVADHGSVAAAARVLQVNHATVLRRIAAFEDRQGIRLFDKTRRGYQVSPDRRALIEAMREAGSVIGQIEQMIDAERPNLQGGIRITSTDSFCQTCLPPMLTAMTNDLGLQVEIIAGNAHLDLGRVQAHITVRPAVALPPELDGEQAANFRFGIYGAHDAPKSFLGLSGPPARSVAGDWLRAENGKGFVVSADSFVTLAGLAAAGAGRALLPAFLGDNWPGLNRLGLAEEIPPTPIWVASHVDYAKSGRLLKARKHLAASLVEAEPRLMGEKG